MDATPDFFTRLQAFTESRLTARKRRRLAQRLKQQDKHWLRDWLEAILWAVCMVLLINQYLFQMYRIPSGSMIGTLEVGDMIFVNKVVYGPELLPGLGKLPGLREPERSEVVVFENPSYISRGPVFTILQQFIYMGTLTFVDIDKDEFGKPRVHYLIKRAVGVGGDTVRVDDGEVSFLWKGAGAWTAEREHVAALGDPYPILREFSPGSYPALHERARMTAMADMGIPSDAELSMPAMYDELAFYRSYESELAAARPHDPRVVAAARKISAGWYVPDGRVFAMGDNRDNSRDARWFGAVSGKKVLGHALFIYWPLGRIRGIR